MDVDAPAPQMLFAEDFRRRYIGRAKLQRMKLWAEKTPDGSEERRGALASIMREVRECDPSAVDIYISVAAQGRREFPSDVGFHADESFVGTAKENILGEKKALELNIDSAKAQMAKDKIRVS